MTAASTHLARTPHRPHVHGPGFTLIELLVVISIIALLIGILLPALASARGLSKQTQSMANLRSIGQAMEIYLNTYNQYYFPIHEPGPSHAMLHDGSDPDIAAASAEPTAGEHAHEGVEWHEMLGQTVPEFDGEVMRSPLDPYRTYQLSHDGELEPIVSYAINGYFEVEGANRRDSEVILAANRSDFDHDGNPITDGLDAHEVHLAFHPWEAFPDPNVDWWEDITTDRHRGSADYPFCDGHVELFKPENLVEEMGDPGEAFFMAEEEEEH